MTRDHALILLALLAMAPSAYRLLLRPEPQPLAVHATERTAQADRVLLGEKVDLNRADAETLQLMPGIGPALAERIVEDRLENGPFGSVEEVERVRGIGGGKRAAMEAWVEVQAP